MRLSYLEQICELQACLLDPFPVCTVYDVNHRVRPLEEISPVGPDGLLASNVPDIEFEAVVVEGLNVEALGWCDCSDIIVTEFLENGCLPCVVQTKNKDASFPIRILQLPQKR